MAKMLTEDQEKALQDAGFTLIQDLSEDKAGQPQIFKSPARRCEDGWTRLVELTVPPRYMEQPMILRVLRQNIGGTEDGVWYPEGKPQSLKATEEALTFTLSLYRSVLIL